MICQPPGTSARNGLRNYGRLACYTLSILEDFCPIPPMSADPNSSAGQEAQGEAEKLAEGRTWGSFKLLAMVGRGSFGEVYRAWDPHLEREVGLKILLPRSAGDEEQFKALLREARALAAVRHPIWGWRRSS